jgi:hypothetical protein
MRLDEITPLLTAVATPRLTATLSAWRVGQVLDAVVTRITSVGTATLNVNNISLDIRSELPLTVGHRLLLEVAQTGTQITLRVLTPPAPTDTVAQALRVLAPRQSKLAPLLNELAKVAFPAATPPTPAPPLTTALATALPIRSSAVTQAPVPDTSVIITPAPARTPASTPAPTLAPAAFVPSLAPQLAPSVTAAAANTPARTNSTTPVVTPSLTPLGTPAPALPGFAATAAASLATALANAPPQLRELAKSVIARIRTPAQTATPEGLKQAVKNAGPFFEHQLATATSTDELDVLFDQDLKAGLLKLVGLLKTILPQLTPTSSTSAPPPAAAGTERAHPPPQVAQLATPLAANTAPLEALAKEVDAALARIITQQVLSLPERDTDAPQWIFDLPLRSGERVDVLHLHVYREKHARDVKQPPAWCVRLSFDLVTLGRVGALVTLFGGSVSVAMWAQQVATAQLFERHLATLRTELQTAGLAISSLRCECGDAPFSPDTPFNKKRSSLIDERA